MWPAYTSKACSIVACLTQKKSLCIVLKREPPHISWRKVVQNGQIIRQKTRYVASIFYQRIQVISAIPIFVHPLLLEYIRTYCPPYIWKYRPPLDQHIDKKTYLCSRKWRLTSYCVFKSTAGVNFVLCLLAWITFHVFIFGLQIIHWGRGVPIHSQVTNLTSQTQNLLVKCCPLCR